jgi:hypothetical protein
MARITTRRQRTELSIVRFGARKLHVAPRNARVRRRLARYRFLDP